MPISALDYLALPRDDEPWILERIIPIGGIGVLMGNPKAGKSFAAIQLACAVAGGLPDWLGIGVKHHGPVLYVQIDMARLDWIIRYVDPLVGSGYDLTHLHFEDRKTVPYPFNTLGEGGMYLKNAIAFMEPKPVLVILDTYRDAHSGNENDSDATRNVLTTLRSAIGEAALLLLHHCRKPLQDQVADIINDLRGSSGMAASMDGFIRIYSPEKSPKGTLTYKSRAADQTVIALARLPDGYWRVDKADEVMIIQEILKQHIGATQEVQNEIIGRRLGCGKSTAYRKRKELGLLIP